MAKKNKSTANSAASKKEVDPAKSWREAIESVVIAIVLAFLFRAFEAEAFVIPTGSMAPTLQGRHKDIECPQCGYQFQAGASLEVEVNEGPVEAVTCPMCFWAEPINPHDATHFSHTGDRILVNKFAYEAPFGSPERWDVVVFKYPGNAKQNYIKRLVGLENETVRIQHGDIYTKPSDEPGRQAYRIARKSPDKLVNMLQLVHDTHYLSEELKAKGWPSSWRPTDRDNGWQVLDSGTDFDVKATDDMAWLDYRHYYLSFADWDTIERLPTTEGLQPKEAPITDFYAYNAQTRRRGSTFEHPAAMGLHWVGDLAVEAELEIQSDSGQLELVLVEAGRKHQCSIDLKSGTATLRINDGTVPFVDDAGQEVGMEVTAATSISGRGKVSLRFANVDSQLLLWVNDRVCEFDQPTTYAPTQTDRPKWSADDPGDLHPVRIGVQNAQLHVDRLRVLRDIYYIATRSPTGRDPIDYSYGDPSAIRKHLMSPAAWKSGDLFDRRQTVEFPLAKDQFFVLGDNSPYSRDSRMWGDEYYVDRDLMIGKAVLIYWPHAWRIGIPGTTKSYPVIPNFKRMGLIH